MQFLQGGEVNEKHPD